MKRAYILLTALLLAMGLTACGAAEEETFYVDTDLTTEETVETVETEETETETQPETQASFTEFQKLTVDEEAAVYDAALGAFVVPFTDDNVRYLADDPCAVGISGGGEAYSMDGTIDMESHPEFENGDYYKGIVVKPAEAIDAGTYRITITFDMYLASFSCTIE